MKERETGCERVRERYIYKGEREGERVETGGDRGRGRVTGEERVGGR